MADVHDVAIVGGGAAGLSAALVLGRARRTVALFDAGDQSNLAAAHVGGLFGHDGTAPAELYGQGRRQLEPYRTVVVHDSAVTSIIRDGIGFVVTADDVEAPARRLLLAMGIRYDPPAVPGLEELWGDSVFHCPFCDGWEMRDRRLAALGSGDELVQKSLLLRNWSADVVALTNGSGALADDASARLGRLGIKVVERPIVELRSHPRAEGRGRALDGVVLDDGTVLERDGLLVTVAHAQRAPFADELGLEQTERATIVVDALGRTAAAGVYAAGDIAEPMQQVVFAAGAGARAAIGLVHDLAVEAMTPSA
jgi:thioredoxin reductase